MCNLYSNLTTHEAMRQLFDVAVDASDLGNLPAQKAIYPNYEAAIVRTEQGGSRSLVRASWGFLTPKKSAKTGKWNKPSAWNNARDDKITSSGLWKGAFERSRCLIPATGYAEATGRNPATYHWARPADAEAFAFAGIWQHRKGVVGDTEVDGLFYSMVTTEPNEFAKQYHNRMPVILAPSVHEKWLTGNPAEAQELLQPYPGEMELLGEGEGLREQPSG